MKVHGLGPHKSRLHERVLLGVGPPPVGNRVVLVDVLLHLEVPASPPFGREDAVALLRKGLGTVQVVHALDALRQQCSRDELILALLKVVEGLAAGQLLAQVGISVFARQLSSPLTQETLEVFAPHLRKRVNLALRDSLRDVSYALL